MMASELKAPEPTPYMLMNKLFATRTVAEHAAHVVPYLKPDSTILDVGCGIGSITLDLAKRVPKGRVVGMDINHGSHIQSSSETALSLTGIAESIEMAQASAKEAGITNVEFFVGNAEDLEKYPTDHFDIAHSHQVMLHLSSPVAALKSMRRVVKPGGIVAIRDNVIVYAVPHSPAIVEFIRLYQEMSRDRGADAEGGKHNHIWLHEAGFPWDKIEIGHASWGYSGQEERSLFAGGSKETSRAAFKKAGKGSDEFYDEVNKAWSEWEWKVEGKLMALDGWCVGKK